jgi:hypothetical protein
VTASFNTQEVNMRTIAVVLAALAAIAFAGNASAMDKPMKEGMGKHHRMHHMPAHHHHMKHGMKKENM